MKPVVNDTKFDSITISGEEFLPDVIIRLNGKIEKQKKKLSKARYGTLHKISVDEENYIMLPVNA